MSVQVGETVKSGPAVCKLCSTETSAILVSKDGHDVYECRTCGLAFTHPQPPALADQYDSAYFDLYRRRRSFRLKRAAARLKAIERLREPGRLLDIGCSLGYFVEAACARGWRASGIEISPVAANEAQEAGLDVAPGVLEDAAFPDGSFDCVTMWDVLEHVSDPVRQMLEVHRILVDGGLVVVGTPDLGHVLFRLKGERWRHLKPAEHIFYFKKATIKRLLSQAGFRPVRPPLIGGRNFPGSAQAALRCSLARVFQPNDVMIVYGVKSDLQIPQH